MPDRILLAVAFGAALAASARAQSVNAPDGGVGAGASPPSPPPQIVVVPEAPPPPPPPPPQVVSQPGDGGTAAVVLDVPAAAGDGGTQAQVAGGPGEPDAGEQEQIILLVPKKPPPPPEPPRQIRVTVMHQPRPRVEWGQASLELGASTGVFMVGSAALFAVELVPIIISELISTGNPVSNALLDGFSVANAIVLPLATTITIERVKAYSRHYTLEGMGWWATLGTGLLMQGLSAVLTITTLNVNNYLVAPHLVVFGALTPISQTVVANVLTTPRDPSAPIEGASLAPVLLDGNGRPIRFVRLLSISF